MPVPKRKRSRARRDKRFANKGVKVKVFSSCSNCQEVVCPHQACKNCGHYKGKQVMATKTERFEKRTETRKSIMEKRAARQQSAQSAESSEGNE